MIKRMTQAVHRVANRPTRWQRLLLWYVLSTLGLFLIGVRLSFSSVVGAVIFGAVWSWEASRRRMKGRTYFTCSCGFAGEVCAGWEKDPDTAELLFAVQRLHSGPAHNLTWSEMP